MKRKNIYTALFALMITMAMTSCAESVSGGTSSSETAGETSAAQAASQTVGKTEVSKVTSDSGETIEAVTASYTANTEGMLDTSSLFTDRDLEQTADLTDAKTLEIKDNGDIDITEGGVYVVSGIANNCTIRIEAEKEKVQLVLDNVSITNDNFPAVYVVNADKCFITTTEGSLNELSVTGSFVSDGDTNTDAVIYSKDDLVFSGMGQLNIVSAQGNGISGKDDIKFTGGGYSIMSSLDAVEAKDSISICGGDFTIESDKDGFHCENDEDDSKGSIYIAGGTFNITAASDGIQAATVLQTDGGEYTINASEGMEATYVQINGGTIDITASDDGINASAKSSAYEVAVEFNGGSTTIDMGAGDTDGIDANGSIYVNGGTIDVTAQMSSFDYDIKAEFNGGTIIINGEEVTEIPEDMMGGLGGHGGMPGGFDGNFPGGFDGDTPPDLPEDFDGSFGGRPTDGFKGKNTSNDNI